MSAGNMHPQQQQKMQEIASKDGNVVYEWTHDTPDRIMPAAEVRYLFDAVQADFLDLVRQNSEAAAKTTRRLFRKEMQAALLAKSPASYTEFQKCVPKFFDFATQLPPPPAPVAKDDTEADSAEFRQKLAAYEANLARFTEATRTIYFMLDMRERVERGDLTQAQASQMVQVYNIKNCNTKESYEDYKKRTGAH